MKNTIKQILREELTTSDIKREIKKEKKDELEILVYKKIHTVKMQFLISEIEKTVDLSRVPDKTVLAAMELGYMKIANRYSCNAIASDCWHEVRREFGFGPWFVFGDLYDHGLPCTNECDIHGAITSLLALGALNNESPAFLTDLTMKQYEDIKQYIELTNNK